MQQKQSQVSSTQNELLKLLRTAQAPKSVQVWEIFANSHRHSKFAHRTNNNNTTNINNNNNYNNIITHPDDHQALSNKLNN